MFDYADNDRERVFFIKDGELLHLHILEERISDFIKKDSRDVVLDLEGLSRFDSQSLASLIRIKRKLDSLDRTLRIINYNEAIFRVIELAGMEDFVL